MKDIVEQLRHDAADKICPYFAAQTMEIAANEIVTLRIIAAQHRDARLAALEELAKHRGPALDVDVWPNALAQADAACGVSPGAMGSAASDGR